MVKLNVLGHIYLRFYVNLLKQAKNDPFSSQIRDDTQPPPLFINGEPEYTIKEIKRARLKKNEQKKSQKSTGKMEKI
jgi:hypothetical protein